MNNREIDGIQNQDGYTVLILNLLGDLE